MFYRSPGFGHGMFSEIFVKLLQVKHTERYADGNVVDYKMQRYKVFLILISISFYSAGVFGNSERIEDLMGKSPTIKGVITSVRFAKTLGRPSVILTVNGTRKITALYSALPKSIQATSEEDITSRLLYHFIVVSKRESIFNLNKSIFVRRTEELIIEKHAQEDNAFMEPV